ncbi:phosphoribosylglycinamide synthetase [Phlyctema vagabunda]|uniref:Phosphoribosylglycinamide synthetase n=1 Tax=Phlyctema vagabunda TaxID=108571 RepID=A0ABR4PXT7_9HELO
MRGRTYIHKNQSVARVTRCDVLILFTWLFPLKFFKVESYLNRVLFASFVPVPTMSSSSKTRVAVLHQAIEPPVIDGSRKPMKPGGYRDSSADIAFALSHLQYYGISAITPVPSPDAASDKDWSFPDTEQGILDAIGKGATHIWANTILFSSHPLQVSSSLATHETSLRVISQPPRMVEAVDDKYLCNLRLRERGVVIAESFLYSSAETEEQQGTRVLKPVRGRGSFGVKLCRSASETKNHVDWLRTEGQYEGAVMSEEFLGGEEITITVLPSSPSSASPTAQKYTALPPIVRFNHHDDVAPYNGTVAVTANSRIVTPQEMDGDAAYRRAMDECEKIAHMIGATAAARIDLRRESTSKGAGFKAFDVNAKPNMTGPGRPGREDQDSLSALAAQGLGWDYQTLVKEIVGMAKLLGEVREIGRPFEEKAE